MGAGAGGAAGYYDDTSVSASPAVPGSPVLSRAASLSVSGQRGGVGGRM